jgi:phospholipid/cholesterol/gamma-HCH transport system substrate-binding protein
MKKYHNETIAGIFVLIGLLGVGYLTVKLGNVPFIADDTYRLFARFNTVSGLRVGNPVEMLGLEVGHVSGFQMDQEKQQAVVIMRIEEGIKIYDDAIASIKTAGLIGDRYVQINPGGGGELLKAEGTITETESPVDIGDLISKYAFGEVKKKE